MTQLNNTSSPSHKEGQLTNRNALFIFAILFAIYLFTFNGQFTSIDELNLYATVESLVQTRTTAVPQVSFAEYHNQVGRHEAGFPLTATPLYWLANLSTSFNNIYTVMLVNPFFVALTAALIYLCARQLGYSSKGSAVAAYAYGLGSLGWPYAISFYREPLVGFLWLLGTYGMISWRNHKNKWLGGIGLISFILSPFVKVNLLFSTPFLLLTSQKGNFSRHKKMLWVGGVALVVLLITFPILYQWRTGNDWTYIDIFSDFSVTLYLLRIYGQLFSPIKGLIFYMPIIMLVFPGFYFLRKEHPLVALGLSLSFFSLIGALSFYGSWYGGQSWGPRLLIPAIPVILIPVAAFWDRFSQKAIRLFTLILLTISTIIQLAVVTNNWWKGYLPFSKMAETPEDYVGLLLQNIALSPPWVLLRNWHLNEMNLIWLRTDRSGSWHIHHESGIILLLCLVGTLIIWRFGAATRRHVVILPILSIIAAFTVMRVETAVGYTGFTPQTMKDIVRWTQP
ncbi:MAG: hypothetical protein GY943_23055, partial [Chloroflexi bacterium]|nr:hypothetical protein [Chloroflexota bacterium]